MMPILSAPVGRIETTSVTKSFAISNKPTDVLAVQRLLNKAACNPPVPEDGKPTEALVRAINDFQSSWTTPDGRVDPGGTTLRRLTYLADGGWSLGHVQHKRIEKGGYRISYGPAYSWTQHYKTYLSVHNSSLAAGASLRQLGELPFCLDISGKNAADVLDYSGLPAFLSALESMGEPVWGNVRYCAIYIARGEIIVGRSRNAAKIDCPIKPLSGQPGVLMPEKDTLPYYNADGAPLVTPKAINNKYWFRFAGRFCTDNAARGLNCCTYPAAVYGLTSNTDCGEHIADAIAPDTVNAVNGESYASMMAYLTKNRGGRHLLWYDYSEGGHVVLVVDGTAHEWSQSHKGYKTTVVPISYDDKDKCLWGSKSGGTYWVRRL